MRISRFDRNNSFFFRLNKMYAHSVSQRHETWFILLMTMTSLKRRRAQSKYIYLFGNRWLFPEERSGSPSGIRATALIISTLSKVKKKITRLLWLRFQGPPKVVFKWLTSSAPSKSHWNCTGTALAKVRISRCLTNLKIGTKKKKKMDLLDKINKYKNTKMN